MVRELLYSGDRQQELAAPNAMVILNIWMQIIQKLYAAQTACKSGQGDPSLFIDEAAAYWIGDSQETGSSTEGHLLYALTEYLGQKYETSVKDSQSDINSRIIDQFNQAKAHMTLTQSCSASPLSHLKLKGIVDELITLMVVPLLQGLFYYLSIRDAVKTKVFALSVLPLFSTCSNSAYMELKGDLIDGDTTDVNKERVFSRIQSMYDCLGKFHTIHEGNPGLFRQLKPFVILSDLTCDLVGFMTLNNYTRCQESISHDEIVGFSYVGDHDTVVKVCLCDV
jgi:hypothetical protein